MVDFPTNFAVSVRLEPGTRGRCNPLLYDAAIARSAGRLAVKICIIALLEGGVERRVDVDALPLVGDPNTR
jgi:hypothetical protein